MIKKNIYIFLLVLSLTGLFAFSIYQLQEQNKQKAIMYKSPTCGCCASYASRMEQIGYDVEIISVGDMKSIKNKYKIPSEMESCHTIEIEGYFVEGHVPFQVLDLLLEERPAIDGISLPRMPSGSPGMPGIKKEIFKIYSLKEGIYELYQEI